MKSNAFKSRKIVRKVSDSQMENQSRGMKLLEPLKRKLEIIFTIVMIKKTKIISKIFLKYTVLQLNLECHQFCGKAKISVRRKLIIKYHSQKIMLFIINVIRQLKLWVFQIKKTKKIGITFVLKPWTSKIVFRISAIVNHEIMNPKTKIILKDIMLII